MDSATITALASGVVAVLVPFIERAGEEFAKEVGKTGAGRIGSLYRTIKTRLQRHPAAAEALADVESEPDNADAQAALRLQLKKQMQADSTFADTLDQLLAKVGQDEQTVTFLTQVYGGKVDRIINIGRAGEVRID